MGQLVEALRLKPGDRGLDSRWGYWDFFHELNHSGSSSLGTVQYLGLSSLLILEPKGPVQARIIIALLCNCVHKFICAINNIDENNKNQYLWFRASCFIVVK